MLRDGNAQPVVSQKNLMQLKTKSSGIGFEKSLGQTSNQNFMQISKSSKTSVQRQGVIL